MTIALIVKLAMLTGVVSLIRLLAAESGTGRTHLAHIVYFTLKDPSPENREALVFACETYLNDHPGTVYFSAGARAEEYQREVNQEFDVALHVVFDSKAAHDAYQVAPRHLKFIAENKPNWASVRVFDAYVGSQDV